MKGLITITKILVGHLFSGMIDVESDRKLHEGIKLKRDRGGWPLTVSVRSDAPHKLRVYVDGKSGKKLIRRVVFDLDEIKGTKVSKVAGKSFDTGKFISWTCSFQKSED